MLMLMLFVALPVFGAAPQVTVTETAVSAKIDAGSTVAVACWLSTPDFASDVAESFTITDSDRDGVATHTFDASHPRGRCAAVDLASGEYGWGLLGYSPSLNNISPPLRDPNGRATQVALPEDAWLLLWVRPGVGAWHTPGGAIDRDGNRNGLYSFLSTDEMKPFTGSANRPAEVLPGDTLAAVPASFAGKLWINKFQAGGSFPNTAPGVFALNVRNRELESVEGEAAAIQIVRTRGSAGTVSVRLAPVGSPGVVHEPFEQRVTFLPGELIKAVALRSIDDDVWRGLASMTLELVEPSGATIEQDSWRTWRVLDDDPMPVIEIGALPEAIQERDAPWTLTVPVTISGKTALDAWLTYGTSAGETRIDFPAGGTTTGTITIPIAANTTPEPDGEITLNLRVENAFVAGGLQRKIRIIDDDVPHLLVSDTAAREHQRVTVTLTADGAASNARFRWSTADGTAVSGHDFVAASGTIAGGSGTIELDLVDDNVAERAEAFFIDLFDVSGLRAVRTRITVMIFDNDSTTQPVLAVENSTITEGASGTQAMGRIRVRISEPLPGPLTVFLRVTSTMSSSEYSATGDRITIPAGASTGELPVTIFGDDADEPDELLNVVLTSTQWGSIITEQGTLTVRDDDVGTAAYLSIHDTRVSEGAAARFRVELSAPQAHEVRVSWTTYSGTGRPDSDYVANTNTLAFAPGETTKWIEVATRADDASESVEAFRVGLYNESGATLGQKVGEALIFDDDTARRRGVRH